MEELFKGKPLQVVKKLKKEIIKETKNIKLDDENFECNGVEEIQRDINIYLEIINGIYQDLLTEYIDDSSVVGVFQDINGEIVYDKIGGK
jgi:hypothetical protein